MRAIQGTAVVVVPVGSVTYKGQKIVYQARWRLCCVLARRVFACHALCAENAFRCLLRGAEGQGGHRCAGAVHHTYRLAGGAHPRQAWLAAARRMRRCLMQCHIFARTHISLAVCVYALWLVRASNTALRMLRKCAAAPAGVLHSAACVDTMASPCGPLLPQIAPGSSTGCKRRICCPLEACSRFLLTIRRLQ